MRVAVAGCCCGLLFLLLLVARGPSDWSGPFAVLMYGLAAASLVLGLVGVISGLLRHNGRAVALSSVPVVVAVGFGVLVYVVLNSGIAD